MKVSTSGLRQDSPAKPLLLGLISYQGITDAAGAASGLTIVCGDLVNEPSYDGQLLKVRSGPSAGQVKPIYVQAGNTLTFATPWTNAAGAVQQIAAGTLFDILSISGGGGGPGPAPRENLSYYGIVDAIPGANQFTIGSLAGLGAGKFDGATNPYYAFVLRDADGAGAAPQGEQLPITAYVTATGAFTTGAFTAAVAVGDEILILHPDVASVLVILAGLAVPGINSVANALMRDVVGNKASTPIFTPDNVSDIIRYLKGILTTINSLHEPSRYLVETWQDILGINPNIWTTVNPAIPWAAPTEAGGFLYAETTLVLNEVARLRSVQQWVEYPNTPNLNLVVKKTILEWEMMLGVPGNLDNAVCIWGFTNGPNDNRVSNDLIGFGLTGGVLQAVVDSAGGEVETPVPGANLTLHNKFRIEIYEGTVDWYVNEVLVATAVAGIPVNPMYIQFLFDTTAAGGCAVDIGIVRCWYEMAERY